MATNSRKLWIDRATEKRIYSDISGQPDPLGILVFYRGSVVPLQIVILEPDPDKINAYNRVDITNLSLTVTINDTLNDATPLVETSGGSWTKDTSKNTFTGALNINTALMNTYLSTDGLIGYFQVKITDTDGNRIPVLREQCTLRLAVDQVTTVAPDPAKAYLTLDEAKGLFVPRIMGAGETITLVSPDGAHERIVGCNDDGTAQDDIIP